jgi:hypothetical protein
MELDRDLIVEARRFVDGANIHCVNTWIFCYELSLPNSPRRAKYEALLREFVLAKKCLERTRRQIQAQSAKLEELKMTSAAINRRIQKLRGC